MRDHEKTPHAACSTNANIWVGTVKPRTIKLPPPTEWIVDIYDYADPKDAAICSLLVELD